MPHPKPNILLVDDRLDNLLVLKAVLRSPEYNLVEVTSGEAALSELQDHDFALIVMDVQMPGLSGYETAMLIKKRKKTEFIPIIFVTASLMDETDADEGYRAGAVDYIMKPFNPDALKAKVLFFANFYKKNRKSQQQLELEKGFQKIIDVVSHDLKNPLGAIKLNVGTMFRLMDKNDTELIVKSLKSKLPSISRSVDQMQNLIDGLLDLAKLEGTEIKLDKTQVDTHALVNEVIEMLSPHAEKKKITIANLTPDSSLNMTGDPERIRQVFSNIIGNAIKFSPENDIIKVTGSIAKDKINYQVEDNGPGIDEENLLHMFDRFWQAESTSKNGTGLGLSISKWIVEAHGGTIWAESKPGHGSCFKFEMPLAS
jgi:signal transduction histidine kinase